MEKPKFKINLSPEIMDFTGTSGEDTSIRVVAHRNGAQPDKSKKQHKLAKTPWQKDK